MNLTCIHLVLNGDLNTRFPDKVSGASDRISKSGQVLPSADLLNDCDGSAEMNPILARKYNLVAEIFGSERSLPLYMGVLFEKDDIVKYPLGLFIIYIGFS